MSHKSIRPYSERNKNKEAGLLQSELSQLGVELPEREALRLCFLADRKYNHYDLYAPGETFQNRLFNWLLNFGMEDRPIAMEIVGSLIFVGHQELRTLAMMTYQEIQRLILSEMQGKPPRSVSAFFDSRNARLSIELSKCLFLAIADDVLFDYFRRYAQSETRSLDRDNFVEYYKLDRECRNDLVEHDRVFLLDQLSGSGFSILGKQNGDWVGKLPTFSWLWEDEFKNCKLYYTPYVISWVAERNLRRDIPLWLKRVARKGAIRIHPTSRVGVSQCLASETGKSIDENKPVAKLCRKYHEAFVEDHHVRKGGASHYGFGGAGLTLVLNTNCPNNTLPAVWHSSGNWYPLFPRVEHHR